MKSTSPYITLLIFGLAALYYGVDNLVLGNSTLAGVFICLGLVLSYLSLSKMGDQRSDHSRYRNRPNTPTHIPSIPDGEYTGENHGTTILNDEVIQEVRGLLQRGRVIDAIRVYRQVTGHNLRESKDFIEKLLQQIQEEEKRK